MEVNLPAQVPLQQATQPAPQQAVDAGATPTIQRLPDNVVTAAETTSDPNVRSEDAFRRQSRTQQETLASLEELQIQGLRTRVGFDVENELVFLEILQPKTEEVIQRIPSEGLVQFLNEQFNRAVAADTGVGSRSVDTAA